MGKIGCLGEIVFEVSSEVVRTLRDMQWSGAARYATHNRHGTHALTEFVGLEPDKISFKMQLLAQLGTNPMEDIGKLWAYERKGIPISLVLGDKIYGKDKWVVDSHAVEMQYTDGKGALIGADVSISLLEYLEDSRKI